MEQSQGGQAVSETPRTDRARLDEHDPAVAVASECSKLERELNRAVSMYRKLDIHTLNLVDRIIRLEAAGDAMERLLPDGTICDRAANLWRKAKEAKL
jgi:hypothetical protein